jgi:hypothetical protein
MSFPSSFIKSLFKPTDFPEHIGLHIKVKIYNGKNYIWFMSPLLKQGFHKIQYVLGKSGTYSQNIRHWLWREVVFNRFDKVNLKNGKVYENKGLKWNKLNTTHKNYFNVKKEIVDHNLDKWISEGGIEKTDKYYLQFVATQEDQKKDITETPETEQDKIYKRLNRLERLVNQLCKMVKGKEEQIQTLKSLVKPTLELEKQEEDKLEEPELVKKTVTFAEPKDLPGPKIGKAKYLNEDLDWEEFDIVELLNEDEILLYSQGEKVGYIENYQNSIIPDFFRDKDNYVINEKGEKLERLFIDNKKKYYYEEEYNSLVGCLQDTNLCEIEYF